MKKGIAALLFLGIGLSAYAMGNPEFHVEKDSHKFIPSEAYAVIEDIEFEGHKITTFWYNPNYTCIEDYQNHPRMIQDIFVDINGDEIPDMTMPEVEKAYREMKERQAKFKPKET